MFGFETFTIDTINREELENYQNKNLFCSYWWLRFLSEWRKVSPLILRITDENNNLIGHFSGCVFSKFGFKILGSPFYGWMGQHMGFDLKDQHLVESHGAELLDETFEYIKRTLKPSFIIFADFKFYSETIEKCKTHFFFDTERWSYFLDLTQSEDVLFKNFKSGYRTCVRKFEKLGGTIEEDYSDSFIEEHHKQLAEVFERKDMTSPNYKERMELLYKKYPEMVLSIKALDENGNNIASSYYLGAGKMAFFASNASLTDALKYNANQALMWYAMKYWKAKGMTILDFAGRAEYKKNFGPELLGTPTVVWAKHEWEYKTVMWLRNTYYNSFRVKYKIKNMFKKKAEDNSPNVEKPADSSDGEQK